MEQLIVFLLGFPFEFIQLQKSEEGEIAPAQWNEPP